MLAVIYGARDDLRPTTTTDFSLGSQVKIWDVKTGRELRSISLNQFPMTAEFTADGRLIATVAAMGQISLWDVQSGSKVRDLTSSPLGSFTRSRPSNRVRCPTMPNMDDLAAMMTNMIGTMSAGTMSQNVTSLAFSC